MGVEPRRMRELAEYVQDPWATELRLAADEIERLRSARRGGRTRVGSPPPPPRTHATPPPMPPPPKRDLGWWVIAGDGLLDALHRVREGADPGLVYVELWANSRTGDDDEGLDNGHAETPDDPDANGSTPTGGES